MKKLFIVSLVLIAFAACGEEPTLGKAETEQALGVVVSASNAGANAASLEVDGAQGRLSVTASAGCEDGGTVAAAGELELGPGGANYGLDLSFDGCTSDGITMDGELGYSGTSTASQTSISLSGEVTFSGAVSASCAIDIEQTASVSPIGYSLTGSACGNDISIVISL